jgi:hypothetical protein
MLLSILLKQRRGGRSELAPIIHALPVACENARNRIKMRRHSLVARVRIKQGLR